MTADEIINAARSQVGVKFMHQGRIAGYWLDCAGLVAFVATTIGAQYNEWYGYGRTPHNGLLELTLDSQPCLEVATVRQPGDILMMRFDTEPQHVAIFTGENIIHSYQSVGQVVEHRIDSKWAARIVKIYRFKGVTL